MEKPLLFVRVRKKVAKGEKKPRFAFVGSVGTDLRIKVKHVRRKEIEKIASIIGADVIYLEFEKDIDEEDDDLEEVEEE